MAERIVPVIAAARVMPAVEENLALAPGHVLRVRRPKEPGVLLDLDEVHEHFTKDEYMPYWATLWPVSLHLARMLLTGPPRSGRALELGCGLGIAGCAALRLGLDVTFTDYDQTCLEWALANARLNAPDGAFRAHPLDIRAPRAGQFELILAADLVYEARNVEPLVATLRKNLAPGGTALLADQNRPYADELKRALALSAFAWVAHPFDADPGIDPDAHGTIYAVTHAVNSSPG